MKAEKGVRGVLSALVGLLAVLMAFFCYMVLAR